MTYREVVDWAMEEGYDFDVLNSKTSAEKLIDFVNRKNSANDISKMSFSFGGKGSFIDGVEPNIRLHPQFIEERERLIDGLIGETIELPELPETLTKEYDKTIEKIRDKYSTVSILKVGDINKELGKVSSLQEGYIKRRDYALKELTWDEVKKSRYARSARTGKNLAPFRDYYGLTDYEARELSKKFAGEAIAEEQEVKMRRQERVEKKREAEEKEFDEKIEEEERTAARLLDEAKTTSSEENLNRIAREAKKLENLESKKVKEISDITKTRKRELKEAGDEELAETDYDLEEE